MDTQALKEKIRQLEGLTDEERNGLLALLNHQKKYGLVWEEKPEEVEERLRVQLPILEEVKERALLSNDPSAPNHILIEGDNLEALVALTYTHEGKVDVIYIDPPYNTGNKDFSYNDSFVNAEDGYRHSKWLSFMSKRLKIAKQLLSDRGVIFISIDDNEQAQLKLLCDEVFGFNNFIAQFVWVKKKKGSHLSKTIRSMTEYVLCYGKRSSEIELYGEDAYSDKQQPIAKRTNTIKLLTFPCNVINANLDDGIYEGRYGKGSSSLFFSKFEVRQQRIITSLKVEGPFIWTQAKLDEELKNGSEVYLSSKFGFNVLRYNQSEKIKRPSTLIDNLVGVGTNEDAYQEIINIFNAEGVMTYPKPTSLIEYLVQSKSYFDKEHSIILDFFAGSGTTLHATMQLNKEDGGHRQCILVTNNENKICEEVTYVRNKRVIQGYVTPKGEFVEGLKANTLRYYRTKLLPRVDTNQNRRALMAACTELLCIEQDLYEEQSYFAGHKLNPRKARYFAQGKRRMLVIYDEQTVDTFAELLREMEVEERIRIYLFSFNGYPHTDNFMEVLDKVELCALPQAIYNVYNRVLPKAVEPVNEEEERP